MSIPRTPPFVILDDAINRVLHMKDQLFGTFLTKNPEDADIDEPWVFLASGYQPPTPAFIVNPEDADIRDDVYHYRVEPVYEVAGIKPPSYDVPDHPMCRCIPPGVDIIRVPASLLQNVQVDSSLKRMPFDVTSWNDNFETHLPGPLEVEKTVEFTCRDFFRPGAIVEIELPCEMGHMYAMVQEVSHGSDGYWKVRARGIDAKTLFPINNSSTKERTMAPKAAKTPKFYVGSKKALQPNFRGETWAKETEAEAIEHAKKLVEQTGEEQFIVKVIKVVKKRPMPIVVETVR